MGPHRVAMTTDGHPDALQPGPVLLHPRLLLGVQPCEDPTPWTGIAWTDVTQPRSASAVATVTRAEIMSPFIVALVTFITPCEER